MGQNTGAAAVAPAALGYSVVNHVLYKDGVPVPQRRSPNIGGKMTPTLLVMHYTGSTTEASAVNTLVNPAAKVSAHLVLDRDGSVTQLVPFNVVAWHAGKSAWGKKVGCNSFSIGIEMVNAGVLLKRADGKIVTQIGAKIIPPTDAIFAKHRITGGEAVWQLYPQAQIEAAIAIGQAIAMAYKIDDVVGHEDIAPKRKTDPGPAFPLSNVRGRILGRK